MGVVQTRSDIVSQLGSTEVFDVVVVGGGIHGASVARQAACSGLKVALLEKEDYAAATSSRSSKMAHGGLRYLEMGDFQQVFEGIKARENLFEDYPELVKPYHFLIPIPRGQYFLQWKLKVGLILYDLMVRKFERKHRWIPRSKLNYEGFDSSRTDLEGCFRYTDGVLSDCRLVLENIDQARRSGAVCLNHAAVDEISDLSNKQVSVFWTDSLNGTQQETKARLVINCAGPWASMLKHSSLAAGNLAARYSQGTHLLFNRPWKGPALFLEMEGKARYYFVWPHFAGTMVGTTEREVEKLEIDPQPDPEEVQEILERLEKDLPNSGLNIKNLHYAFAGIRTLPLRSGAKETGRLSRKHIWSYKNGLLTLLGGKLTTADWTAKAGVKQALKLLGKESTQINSKMIDIADVNIQSHLASFTKLSIDQKERLTWRYGTKIKEVLVTEADAESLGVHAVRGELRYAVEHEQAETIEDVLRRRLELEYMPGSALDILDQVQSKLTNYESYPNVAEQIQSYKDRLTELFNIMNLHS